MNFNSGIFRELEKMQDELVNAMNYTKESMELAIVEQD